MSSITFSKLDLANLIDHHIALLERFGITDEAPFSLVFFTTEDKKEAECVEMLKRILRSTDVLFNQNNHYIVMLTGTDWNGATEILSGIQEFLDQSPKDAIVTYPEDGLNAKAILKRLHEVIEDNYAITTELLK